MLATVVFFRAVPGNCLLNNETVAPMDNETRLSIEFIQMKEKEFQLGPEKEAVVILGDYGAGKSTLSLLLTNGEMKSIRDEPILGYYFVDEYNRICSKMFCNFTLPVTDTFNNITYYDWSAFQDSSANVSVEVLASHTLKKFARSEKSAKFVFAIPQYYFNIVSEMRLDSSFVHLAEVASDLFVNIDKYRNAIGFVVTKSSLHNLEGTIEISDEDTIEIVVDYLESMRTALTNDLNDLNGNNERDFELKYYNLNGIIRFINVLLEKKDGKYKIGVFKQPDKAGLVKELMIQQDEKIAIQSMIANQLLFVKCDTNDFGYAVRYKTKQKELYRKIMLNLKQ